MANRFALTVRTRDYARLAMLCMLASEVFILPPLYGLGVVGDIGVSVASSLTLVVGALTVGGGRVSTLLAVGFVVLSFLARLALLGSGAERAGLVEGGVTLLASGFLVVVILRYVFGKERSTVHRMVGAVAAYLLIAIIWARGYFMLHLVRPDAFDLPHGRGSLGDFVYYSFATITTLGYGIPVSPVARSLTSVEALVGQLYPAILLARLLTL